MTPTISIEQGTDLSHSPITKQKPPLVSLGGLISGDANAAAYLGCCRRTVNRLRIIGGLPYMRLGRIIKFRASDLDNYLNNRQRGEV